MLDESVAFGPFVFDAARALLTRDGEPLPLGHRAATLLAVLLEADGETVGRDTLLERAWPSAVVEEANLTVQMAALRRALGQSDDGGDWILTVPRVGYRLPRRRETREAPHSLPAIAVLPFANLGADRSEDYFADGITEDLIIALSRFRSFSVVSRGSSFALRGRALDSREAGRLLGARYLLEGSVRRGSESVRVTAQLVDATTGEQLWSERLDGNPGEIFAMQDRITETVIGLVQPHIQKAEIERARRQRPENLDAYDLYLRALPMVHGTDPSAYVTAIELLRRASALEPNFALALALTGWTIEKRITLNMPPLGSDDAAAAVRLARAALALDPGDPLVLASCGWLLVILARDYDGGLAAARRARAANPNDILVLNVVGTCEMLAGDLLAGRRDFLRAVALGPNAPEAYLNLTGIASSYVDSGENEEALAWGRRSLETFNEWPVTLWTLAAAAGNLGRLDEARGYVARLRELAPHFSLKSFSTMSGIGNVERWGRTFEGLRRAGLPET